MRELIVFADVEEWATGFLRAQLAARPEPYAAGVFCSIALPDRDAPARAVIVRRDGGPQTGLVTEVARLGINIYAPTDAEANGLARLSRAILLASPGEWQVRRASATGHSSLPDEPAHKRRYLTAELYLRAL